MALFVRGTVKQTAPHHRAVSWRIPLTRRIETTTTTDRGAHYSVQGGKALLTFSFSLWAHSMLSPHVAQSFRLNTDNLTDLISGGEPGAEWDEFTTTRHLLFEQFPVLSDPGTDCRLGYIGFSVTRPSSSKTHASVTNPSRTIRTSDQTLNGPQKDKVTDFRAFIWYGKGHFFHKSPPFTEYMALTATVLALQSEGRSARLRIDELWVPISRTLAGVNGFLGSG
ncbi:hypothetical protein V8F06_006581 [Rhypophila decipiens]